MSSDIATLLTGRYVEIQMLPLSFAEFYYSKYEEQQYSLIPAYEAYLRESSFPYTQQLGGEDFDIQEYLRGLFNTLLLHDVVARLKLMMLRFYKILCDILWQMWEACFHQIK